MSDFAALGWKVPVFPFMKLHMYYPALPAKCSWAKQINLQWFQKKKMNIETGIT